MVMDAFGIIYCGGDLPQLGELTATRSAAALPVASRYRVIDFVLSNMVNSGIRNVGIIPQRNYHSLMDHLGTGKEWDLHSKRDGLFILPPYSTRESVFSPDLVRPSMLDGLLSILAYIRRSKQKYVILSGSRMIHNTTYHQLLRAHIESDAHVTMLYRKADPQILATTHDDRVYLSMDENHQVTGLEINPHAPSTQNLWAEVCILQRQQLLFLLNEAASYNLHDFSRDLLQKHIRESSLRVFAHELTGYARRIESVLSYYRMNMELLQDDVRSDLFGRNTVYTKVRDEVPATYTATAGAHQALVADGCIIEGEVENSVLFRGVKVRRGAKVKNCILMQDADVQADVTLENTILDKQVIIRQGHRLIGDPAFPIVVSKGTVI